LLPPTQRPSTAHHPHSGNAVHCAHDKAVAQMGETTTTGAGVDVDGRVVAGALVIGAVVAGAVGAGGVVVNSTATPTVVVQTGVVFGHSLQKFSSSLLSFSSFFFLPFPFFLPFLSLSSLSSLSSADLKLIV